MLSHFSCVWLFVTLWAVAVPLPLSMGFSKQGYWSGLPCPPPGDLPNPVIEPSSLMSPALACMFFITSATWKPQIQYIPPKISFIFSLVPVLPSVVYDLVNDITQSRGATQTLSSLLPTSSPPSCTSVLPVSAVCVLFIAAASLCSNSHSLCPDWACSLKPTDVSQEGSIIVSIRGPVILEWRDFSQRCMDVTWKLGSPRGGCQAKKPNQAKERGKEGFIITCSKLKELQGSFPKQCLLEQQNGEVLC